METISICGRSLNERDIEDISRLIQKHRDKSRRFISQRLCEQWNWRYAHGHLKDSKCRTLLVELERRSLIKLPALPERYRKMVETIRARAARVAKVTVVDNISAVSQLTGSVGNYGSLSLKVVNRTEEEKLWNSLIHQYHYQGYKFAVGSDLKYLAYLDGQMVACLGWASAAWRIKGRDTFIGWTNQERLGNLHKVVNNVRFLILPQVKVKFLASKLLAQSVKQLPKDWQRIHGHKIVLLETFVERNRFKGTCYKAANWMYAGHTKGTAKSGNSHHYHGIIKDIYVYPLRKDFRNFLREAQ